MLSASRAVTTQEGQFASTRWTVIRSAAESHAPTQQSLNALSELCAIYWQPVYLFLRRQGSSPHDAQDLSQSFFADLIESRTYARADERKGRFRSFLLGTLKHFLADARDRERAQKRGGGLTLLPLDETAIAQAEAHAVRSEGWSADRLYEREWAAALLRQVMDRLQQESQLAGKGALFAELRSHLGGGPDGAVRYEELAARLGRPAATLRSDVARLRARYRTILREEVRGTVTEAENVDEELQHLRQVMAA
ncbi:MAG TPA: RNA polymerase subunit sigma-24 [Chthoniobacterales bacterium]|nr:RNA polymerase subunit sigma-24 [Chthoniobacterales bacterium]